MTRADVRPRLPSGTLPPLVFVDLETSGANFANDRIIEIGLLSVDDDEVREWHALVNPQLNLSPFIRRLTGIDDTMLASAPHFAELAPQVLEQLRGRLFIAHNARFDYGFLKAEFRRLGIDFVATTLCTVKLSRALFPEHHRHNLDTLLTRFGITVEGDRHRALADARTLWDLWRCWRRRLPPEIFAHAVDTLIGRPNCPPQLDPIVLDDLPEAAGAYAFYDVERRLLLVNRSPNLRQQVVAHFATANREQPLYQATCHIAWRDAAGEFGARLGELALTRQAATRAVNRRADEIPDTDSDWCSWQVLMPSAGDREDFQLRLVFTAAVDFASTDRLFGIYPRQRDAERALRKLAEAHALCLRQLGLEDPDKGGGCAAYRQKKCRGVCIGKESAAQHGMRLLTALAKFSLQRWPYPGAVVLSESDDFGMRTDWHLVDRWRHLGTWTSWRALAEAAPDLLTARPEPATFDPEVYRLLRRRLRAPGKVRIQPLPSPIFAGDPGGLSESGGMVYIAPQ
ncbi:MAG: ethanolamine utilization protein [Candidatus Accumulibacter sp.]|nr:ethanolamine utilization protein [Accumulibacter sp.]